MDMLKAPPKANQDLTGSDQVSFYDEAEDLKSGTA